MEIPLCEINCYSGEDEVNRLGGEQDLELKLDCEPRVTCGLYKRGRNETTIPSMCLCVTRLQKSCVK